MSSPDLDLGFRSDPRNFLRFFREFPLGDADNSLRGCPCLVPILGMGKRVAIIAGLIPDSLRSLGIDTLFFSNLKNQDQERNNKTDFLSIFFVNVTKMIYQKKNDVQKSGKFSYLFTLLMWDFITLDMVRFKEPPSEWHPDELLEEVENSFEPSRSGFGTLASLSQSTDSQDS